MLGTVTLQRIPPVAARRHPLRRVITRPRPDPDIPAWLSTNAVCTAVAAKFLASTGGGRHRPSAEKYHGRFRVQPDNAAPPVHTNVWASQSHARLASSTAPVVFRVEGGVTDCHSPKSQLALKQGDWPCLQIRRQQPSAAFCSLSRSRPRHPRQHRPRCHRPHRD